MFGKREASIYEAPLGPQGMRAKFKNLVGLGKKNEGWVRANNGSTEWDASDRNLVFEPATASLDVHGTDSPFTPPRPHAPSVHRSSTSESIELSVPSGQQTYYDAAPGPSTQYSDPFASPTSPTASTETEGRPSKREDSGRFSVQSGDNGTIRSMRKFDSGTKFKEAIDFQ